MKRRDLIKRLEEMGCVLIRNGGKHDWYSNPITRRSQPVPRHTENQREFSKVDFEEIVGRVISVNE